MRDSLCREAVRIIEVIADAGHQDTIQGLAGQYEVSDIWYGPVNEDRRISVKLLLSDDNHQESAR